MKLKSKLLIAAGMSALVLYPVVASADQNSSGDQIETVVVTSYVNRGTLTASKLDVDARDLPVSISSYSKDFMKSIESENVSDLYRYMTGVERAGNTGYDLVIRGFKTSGNDPNAIMVDGLPGLTVRFGSPPTAGVDHIEVVKGPASILYGQAQPGGFVNIISKKPSVSPSASIKVVASDETGRPGGAAWGEDATLDLTGPLDSKGEFLYRMIAEIGDTNHFRTASYDRPVYVAPSFTWNVDDNTIATLQLEYRHLVDSYDTYLVAPNFDITKVAPAYTRYQQPTDWGREDGETATIGLFHQFDNGMSWNLRYRSVYHTDTASGFDVVGFSKLSNFILQRRARGQENARIYNFGDTYLNIPFHALFADHKLVVGAQYGAEWDNFRRTQFYNAPDTGPFSLDISVYNPDYSTANPLSYYPTGSLNDRVTTSTDYGFYFNDLMTFSDQWKAMVGLRDARSLVKQVTYTPGKPTTQAGSNGGDWLPMGGIIYQPTEQLQFYTSYSTSYVPQSAGAQDANGNGIFSPMTADSIEVGTKDTFLEGRLSTTFALFSINESNVLNSVTCILPATGTCSAPIGQERSQGAELEIDAAPLPGWELAAGYGYTDATVSSSTIANQVGAQLQNVPLNDAHVWSRYNVQSGPLKGAGFGFGMSYVDARTGTLPTATSTQILRLPSYVVTDAALYYGFSNYDLTFKISNLTDEHYYESAGFTGQINILPGTPRTFTLSLEAKF